MFIRTELDRLFIVFLCTVIRVTEGTIKLAFDDKFLVLTFYHECFHTITACNFIAANQVDRFSIFKIKVVLAEETF